MKTKERNESRVLAKSTDVRHLSQCFCPEMACSHDDVIDLVDYLLVTLSMIDLEVSKCEIILDVDRFYGD